MCLSCATIFNFSHIFVSFFVFSPSTFSGASLATPLTPIVQYYSQKIQLIFVEINVKSINLHTFSGANGEATGEVCALYMLCIVLSRNTYSALHYKFMRLLLKVQLCVITKEQRSRLAC